MHSAPTTVRNRRYGSGRPHFWRLLHAEWLRISSLNHDVKPWGPIFVQKSGHFRHRCMQCGEIPEFPAISREAHDFTPFRTVDAVYLLIGRSRPLDRCELEKRVRGGNDAFPGVDGEGPGPHQRPRRVES